MEVTFCSQVITSVIRSCHLENIFHELTKNARTKLSSEERGNFRGIGDLQRKKKKGSFLGIEFSRAGSHFFCLRGFLASRTNMAVSVLREAGGFSSYKKNKEFTISLGL